MFVLLQIYQNTTETIYASLQRSISTADSSLYTTEFSQILTKESVDTRTGVIKFQ